MEQEQAFKQVRKLYGNSGFTEDHIDYRMVGYRKDGEKVFAIGPTWEKAFTELEGYDD